MSNGDRPAFPVPGFGSGLFSGMTLRDWFAGQAMQARIIALGHHGHENLRGVDVCHAETAERAYRHADAMLKAREQS